MTVMYCFREAIRLHTTFQKLLCERKTYEVKLKKEKTTNKTKHWNRYQQHTNVELLTEHS